MASSQEVQKQLGVGCCSTDLRLPFSCRHKLLCPLHLLRCFGGSHLVPSSFSLHHGEVRETEKCVCVCVREREGRDQGSRTKKRGDHPGRLSWMQTFPSFPSRGAVVFLGLLTGAHSSLCLAFLTHLVLFLSPLLGGFTVA